MLKSVSLFASLLAIPLACQCCLHATLFTGLQIVGVTLHFLDNVLLLYLPLKPAQSIFERLAFLYANLCQEIPPPNPPNGLSNDTGTAAAQATTQLRLSPPARLSTPIWLREAVLTRFAPWQLRKQPKV